ncbi:PREDICTED: proline-rich protein 3-like [Tarenaya hassleriana]|uniref:proline-rich protein 3-like n=1 Tax=Tarenaya hassleriana TaxID=28532 RepID=UPI00053C67BC|nr:PREDICTED: proline-rich protein 3-like [Tarenaya hassleriana]
MAVTRASFAIFLHFCLAAIAAAGYYNPATTPSHPVYTPVHKPTLPPVYTPPVKKPTLPPPVYTPPVYTYTPPVKKPSEDAPKPHIYSPPVKPYVPVAIDGVILCKHGYNTYPIKGAKAKLVCSEVDSYGKNKEEVVLYSKQTDGKGYFELTVTEVVKDIALCRVKLHSSPMATCKNPTNVNKGLTGAPLSLYNYRTFPDRNLKMYSVGPFYFTGSEHAPPHPNY